ncbi:MAG: hypothetical protein DBY25_03910 [Clostridiales bacterium]|nr:MAG: hypothetical protein DBY25_03910 [Clostridiales bacterium]
MNSVGKTDFPSALGECVFCFERGLFQEKGTQKREYDPAGGVREPMLAPGMQRIRRKIPCKTLKKGWRNVSASPF